MGRNLLFLLSDGSGERTVIPGMQLDDKNKPLTEGMSSSCELRSFTRLLQAFMFLLSPTDFTVVTTSAGPFQKGVNGVTLLEPDGAAAPLLGFLLWMGVLRQVW